MEIKFDFSNKDTLALLLRCIVIQQLFKTVTINIYKNYATFEFIKDKPAHILDYQDIEKLIEELSSIRDKLEQPISQKD